MGSITDFLYENPYLIGFIAMLLAAAGMPIVLTIARDRGLVVKPNKRTSHVGDIPNIGGVDILFSFVLSYLLFEFDNIENSQFLFIGIFIIAFVGLIDDILDITPLQKIMGELLAGIAMIGFADIRISSLCGFCGINQVPLWFSYCLSFFVLIVIINALNLIDGVDGLASGLGMLFCLFFGIYFHLTGYIHWAILAYCLTGSLAVFFIYNVFGGSKRKIFMGDSGSLLLGYMITAFVFTFCEINSYQLIPQQYAMSAAPAVAICVLSVPLFDTLRVMGTRIKHHRSPFSPDRNHIHHLLLKAGLNHLQTTCVLLTASIIFIALGILGRNWNMWLLVTVDFLLCMGLTWILWRAVEKKITSSDNQNS